MNSLYAHQQEIVGEDPHYCGLWLGTGTGKTRTALLLARGKTLVIAPKTQVEDQNWNRENVLLGGHVPFLAVISKEMFRRDNETLADDFETIIVDEAHTCLGATPNVRWVKKVPYPRSSQLFDALTAYIERTQPKRVYLCTATIMRSPMTVWAAGKVLGHPAMQYDMRGFYAFRDEYYVKLPMPGREVWAPRRDDETKDNLAAIVRKLGYVGRLEDFFDVPEQTFKTIHVELTKQQQQRIKEIKLEYPDPIVSVGKRHQIENGILNGDEFNPAENFDNEKIDKIMDLALEFPRMVIFCKYLLQIDIMRRTLEKKGYRVCVLTGDTQHRGDLIRYANDKKECIFIAQAQISAGWELPDYPVMVFASRTYSYVDYVQALGRIHRANRLKKNLYINLVVKGGVDEGVDKSLLNKQDFDERIYGEMEEEQVSDSTMAA